MTQSLSQALAAFTPPLPLGVALSAGADSCALLVACAQRWPGQVHALHINHGLQAAAQQFEQHAQALSSQLGVALRVLRVHATAAPGQSPEDAARIARYQGLAQLAQDGPPLAAVALAQHADDQVETLLLALTRGAGIAGLAAMPARFERYGTLFLRPLLRVAGADLRAWLEVQGISHVEDPSNQDIRYTRNHIRQVLLPALQQVMPQFRDTLARSSQHAAQAQQLLAALAQEDWLQCADAAGLRPSIKALQRLAPERQANLLRYWLKSQGMQASSAQLHELQSQITACRTRGHAIDIRVGQGRVRRQGDGLDCYNP